MTNTSVCRGFNTGLPVLFNSRTCPVNCNSPVFTASSLRCPLAVVDATGREGHFECVLISLSRCPSITVASGQLLIQYSLWQTMILHPGYMQCPAQQHLTERGLKAGGRCLLEDFNARDEVTSVDVEDGTEAAVIEAFKEEEMAFVVDPGFGAI
ncbi:hypothetical protein CHS0354_008497 [Potamilus streckersoni]|uniref:Uncharacterized protein n=1 Tax=Potamilus streckersoni TaxID=2493646 RepID=A0AAE0VS10_9BIVA|nr:hypothetical protein CHS0354_008497 [Potamilus streckersoni]